MGENRQVDNKASKIQALLGEVTARTEAGETVDIEALISQHQELMPELGEQLSLWKTLCSARAMAEGWEFDPAASPDIPESLQNQIDGYRLLELLHSGGQGVVYRALQYSTRRMVAVKVLHDGPAASERRRHRFEREVELLSRLEHPHIVTIYDSGVVHGRYFFAMEYVDGETITDYALLHGLDARQRVEQFIDVVMAASFAHQRGVIHRDLKPSNILVDLEGKPRILDFGLAKVLETSSDDETLSLVGQIVGTLPYMSPEQASGLEEIDIRTDVYALGAVLFEMLAGEPPIPTDADRGELRRRIMTEPPRRLREVMGKDGWDGFLRPADVGEDLEAILAMALAKTTDERYQSAAALADDLRRYLAGEPVEAQAARSWYLIRKAIRRYRVPVTLGALAIGMVMVFAVVAAVQWREAVRQRDNARRAVKVAHSTLDQVVSEMDESITPLAGGKAVRKRLLSGVDDQLAELRPLVSGDASLVDVTRSLYEKRGDIAVAEGRVEDARREYAALMDFAESGKGVPSSAELEFRASTHRKIAQVSEDPVGEYSVARQYAEKLFAQEADPESARLLARVCVDMATLHHEAGRGWDALKPARRAADLADQVERSSPEGEVDESWARLQGAANSILGQILVDMSQSDEAKDALSSAVDVYARLVDRNPYDSELRLALLRSMTAFGNLQRMSDSLEIAEETLNRAAVHGELLVALDPTVVVWAFETARAHRALGIVCVFRKDYAAAARSYQRAAEILKPLVGRGLMHSMVDSAYAAIRAVQASCMVEANFENDVAFEYLDETFSILRRLARQQPDLPRAQWDLGLALGEFGHALRQADRYDQALAAYQQSLKIYSDLLKSNPDWWPYRRQYIVSLSKFATWHLDQKTPDDDILAASYLERVRIEMADLEAAHLMDEHRVWATLVYDMLRRNHKLVEDRASRARGRQELSPGAKDISQTTR